MFIFSKDYIKRHVDKVHNKIENHKCDFCGKLFVPTYQLKNNIQNVHEEINPENDLWISN